MRYSILLAALLLSNAATAQSIDPKVQVRIDRILKKTPLIDGHNDIAEALQENYDFSVANLASGTERGSGENGAVFQGKLCGRGHKGEGGLALSCGGSSGAMSPSKGACGGLPIGTLRLWVFGQRATFVRNSQKREASCCGEQETSFFVARAAKLRQF